jgi:CRISPR/Cas system CMR subunit Cmr4 (Cas7 group RAMP superfamily)
MSGTHRYVLRGTLEFTTPFLVGAGRKGDVADAVFVADPNGLPAIPGSSLAGVLRARFQERHGEEATNRLFGFQRKDQGEGSRWRSPGGVSTTAGTCPWRGWWSRIA